MSAAPDRPDGSNPQGRALVERLLGMHEHMRAELEQLRAATAAIAGPDPEGSGARDAVASLDLRRHGWMLQRFCVQFCGFVHGHHSVEDSALFPTLLMRQGRDDPNLPSAIERLKAEHRELAGHLDKVTRALDRLPGEEADRAAAIAALERLSDHMEAHLRFEEDSISLPLSRLTFADA